MRRFGRGPRPLTVRHLAVRAGRARVRITGRMERRVLEIAAWGTHRCQPFPVRLP